MIRPVLAIMAGLLCGVMGMRQAQRIRQESTTLHRWQCLLQRLCLLLQSGSLSLPEAFEHAACEDTQADMLLRRIAASLRAHPLTPLAQLYIPQGKEGDVLARMFSGLARGSLDARILAVQQAEGEMALLAESARSKTQQDAGMWAKLGWICGACLTLMLL